MKIEYIKYALDNIFHRKMRSFLTVLSILIGITSIYALISFGQGLSVYIEDLSSEVGADKLIFQAKGVGAPGTDENFFVTKEEIDFIGKINGIDESIGLYFKVIEIEDDNQKKFVFTSAVPFGDGEKLYEELFNFDFLNGRKLKKGDKFKVNLGYSYTLPDKVFKKPLKVGDKILINNQKFEVIGFYDTVGNPQDDSNVYITEEMFEFLFPKNIDQFQMGLTRVSPNMVPAEVAERAEEKLRKFKDQDKGQEDFFIQTFEQAIAAFSSIILILNAVLILIALISLVVAAVNIANTMYTAVLERTKEIGIMKAIGAKNIDILSIFLIEAGFLGLIGGIFGIILGFLVASAGGAAAAQAGFSLLKPVFPLWLTIGSLLFAFLVGTGSGFLPSIQASKLKPVDALRYE